MCLKIADADKARPFFKTDHESDYKNFPLAPDSAKLCLITLRNPADGLWYGFWPRALLFGASSAVLHYDAFSRIAAVLASKIFGFPIVGYWTFRRFSAIIHFALKDIRTKVGMAVTVLGLAGPLQDPWGGMFPSIDLTDGGNKIGQPGLANSAPTNGCPARNLSPYRAGCPFPKPPCLGGLGGL